MLCIVANYNLDDKARELKSKFEKYCNTLIVDSSGIVKDGFIGVENGFNFQKSCELFISSREQKCLFICSDVEISSAERITYQIERLKKDIGIYTPCVVGKSHSFLKPSKSFDHLINIPFAEGMILCSNREIIIELLNRNVITKTYLGWGLDVYKGYLCKQLGYKCVMDNYISVYHPESRSYNSLKGKKAMSKFVNYIGSEFKEFCQNNGFELNLLQRLLFKIKKIA